MVIKMTSTAKSSILLLIILYVTIQSSLASGVNNIITVAKQGGDFTDITAAVDSIADARFNNRYIIKVAPGRYALTETLKMRDYVDIEGSGIDATVFVGKIIDSYLGNTRCPQNAKVVLTPANAKLSHLSIDVYNSGSKSDTMVAICVANNSHNGLISDVNVRVRYGEANYGLYINQGTAPLLRNVFLSVQGRPNSPLSDSNYGIYIDNSTASTPTVVMKGGEIKAWPCNTSNCVGVFASEDTIVNLHNVSIFGYGNALLAEIGGVINFRFGSIAGNVLSADIAVGEVRLVKTRIEIFHSTIKGDFVGPGINRCHYVTKEIPNPDTENIDLNSDCSEPI